MTPSAEPRALSPASDPLVCWICHGVADPASTNWLRLQGALPPEGVDRLKRRDSLGCEVDSKGLFEYVSVPIPRCRACLVGARNVAGLFAALPMLALAVGFGAVHSQLSGLGWDADPDPLTDPMGDFLVFLGGLIGWIGGFYLFITIVCRVLGATRKRPKADKRFPLVAALLARGWSFQDTD